MLNLTVLEGYVTGKIWRYDGLTFARVAVYRDEDLPRKTANRGTDGVDKPDYVTVAIPQALMAPIADRFGKSARIQVHGFLESEEYTQTLGDFLRRAGVGESAVDPALADVTINRVSTQVVARRVLVLPDGNGNGSR